MRKEPAKGPAKGPAKELALSQQQTTDQPYMERIGRSSVAGEIGLRDEPLERRLGADGEELPITLPWLRAQVLENLRRAKETLESFQQLYAQGLADAARDTSFEIQEFEWQATLHAEKMEEMALGSYVATYCTLVSPSVENLELFETRSQHLCEALEKAGELPERAAVFAERNLQLQALWREWNAAAASLSGSEAFTELKAQWQPRFDALYQQYRTLAQDIGERHRAWHTHYVQSRSATPEQADNYPLFSMQEWDALERSAADGRTGRHYQSDSQAEARVHRVKGLSHYVKLALTPNDRDAGVNIMDLERLTGRQDADCIFALLYVSSLLAPAMPLPSANYAGGWVSLDDIIEKIGWRPRSTKEREGMREQVWDYLRFGARAAVIGRRTGRPYVDKLTGKEIDTQIEAPLWSFLEQEKPIQPSLMPSYEVPLRVEIVLSKRWEHLITNPSTAQYLPLGELLGSIPGNQPSGAWARTLGLALASFWRRHPRETLAGTLRPSRQELLQHYTPRKQPLDEILSSPNPIRALEYWHGSLQELVHTGFLAPQGEAALTLEAMKSSLPRYKWQDRWLEEKVVLLPGARMQASVQTCAASLPPLGQPKALPNPKRPRKKKTGGTENASE